MNRLAPADVTVAILAGGLGTRLRPAVADRPKVLAKVNGRPFLAYLLDQIAEADFRKVVLCTGYRAADVEAEFGPTYHSLRLGYSQELEALGTGGALRLALPLLKTSTVLVLNGDSFADANLADFWQQHSESRSRASLLLVWMGDSGRYGQVELSGKGSILSFREKQAHARAGWINAGVYLLDRELIAGLPADRAVSLERESFPAWLGLPLRGIPARSRFLDIGTPESYREAEEFFNCRNSQLVEANAAVNPVPLAGVTIP